MVLSEAEPQCRRHPRGQGQDRLWARGVPVASGAAVPPGPDPVGGGLNRPPGGCPRPRRELCLRRPLLRAALLAHLLRLLCVDGREKPSRPPRGNDCPGRPASVQAQAQGQRPVLVPRLPVSWVSCAHRVGTALLLPQTPDIRPPPRLRPRGSALLVPAGGQAWALVATLTPVSHRGRGRQPRVSRGGTVPDTPRSGAQTH